MDQYKKTHKKKTFKQVLEDRIKRSRNSYQQLDKGDKSDLLSKIEHYANISTAQAQQLLSTLSSHQMNQITQDFSNFQKIDLHLFQLFQKSNLKFISEELKISILKNTGLQEDKFDDLLELNVEILYFLGKYSITELMEKFSGKTIHRILKTVAFIMINRENPEFAMEIANTISINDSNLIGLCLMK